MGDYRDVCVVGLGYVGLPTALIAASSGYRVVGFDCNAKHVHALNNGIYSSKESGLANLLHNMLESKQFYATDTIQPADCFVIAVPTPLEKTMHADVQYVYAAVNSVAQVLQPGNTVLVESTIPVGITQKIIRILSEKTGMRVGKDFFCAYCPERVLPGNVIHEIQTNDRVIGCCDKESGQRATDFYVRFVSGECTVVDAKTAELVKLLENGYRDVQIAFAHQVAQIAQTCSVDPFKLIDMVNKHPRVNVLKPSAGVGGHCIALDPWFLISEFAQETSLLRCARMTNDQRPELIVAEVKKLVDQWHEKNSGVCTVACLGATYKPNVDDMRQSPALSIIQKLITCADVTVDVVEPYGCLQEYGIKAVDIHKALSADIIVCLVAHTYFERWRTLIQSHAFVYDACGFLHTQVKLSNRYTQKKGKNNETSCS